MSKWMSVVPMLWVFACGGSEGDGGASPDAGSSGTPDAALVDAAPQSASESEPNNGNEVDEFNPLDEGVQMLGAIGEADDVDIFRLETEAGSRYHLSLEKDTGSMLELHLTAMDAGRDGSAAGNDYIKISSSETANAVTLDLLAMGQGGYFVIVRDRRNVSGAGGQGSSEHSYRLEAQKLGELGAEALSFPSSVSGGLASPGDVALYSFAGTEGSDIVIDLQASGDMDGRLILYSASTGDWIARNDDRAQGQSDPLIDAFLTASGDMLLVVENIAEGASSLGFQMDSQLP